MLKCWNLGYEKSKIKARKIYKKIGRVQCPIFNGELVSFSSKGFSHLIRKGRIPRTRNEQKKRFFLLQYAEDIVKDPSGRIQIEFEEREVSERVNRFGKKVTIKKAAKAWTVIQVISDCKVKLVIGQVDGRGKEFVSIMSRDIKVSKPKRKKVKTKNSR